MLFWQDTGGFDLVADLVEIGHAADVLRLGPRRPQGQAGEEPDDPPARLAMALRAVPQDASPALESSRALI